MLVIMERVRVGEVHRASLMTLPDSFYSKIIPRAGFCCAQGRQCGDSVLEVWGSSLDRPRSPAAVAAAEGEVLPASPVRFAAFRSQAFQARVGVGIPVQACQLAE